MSISFASVTLLHLCQSENEVNIDIVAYFVGDNKYESRPKSTAVKDINITNILGQKYRYCVGIDEGDPPLVASARRRWREVAMVLSVLPTDLLTIETETVRS